MDRQQTSRCELCGRGEVTLTEHHLIPKEMGGTFLDTAIDMYSMSKQIHALYTNEELASRLGSIEKLRTDEKSKYIKWIRKQPAGRLVRIRKSNSRRGYGR